MRRWFGVLFIAAAAARAPAQLAAIEAAVREAETLGARAGVAIADDHGQVLFRHRAAEPFVPASNLKLLTAIAVLRGLGPDYRFRTTFQLQAGRLVVTASGDPNWIDGTAHAPALVFGQVTAALQRLGVQRLAGVDLENGSFTGPARPPTWPQDQLHLYYCAPTGPFVLEQGTFRLRIAPGADGRAAVQLLAPPAGLPLRGVIELVDDTRRAIYGATDTGAAVQLRGKFARRAAPATVRGAVTEPRDWYRATLLAALERAGIDVGARTAANADTTVLDYTTDLLPAVRRMLEDSSNFDAEQLLRVLAAEQRGDGSLRGGAAAMVEAVTALVGRLPDGVVVADGSGLSRQNRVTPGLCVVALARCAGTPAGDALFDSLPVAGRSGTLAGRFLGTDLVGRVRAKTGWIRGASALSGVVERRGGGRVWFSILVNYDADEAGRNADWKRLQETIVAAIDRLEAE